MKWPDFDNSSELQCHKFLILAALYKSQSLFYYIIIIIIINTNTVMDKCTPG